MHRKLAGISSRRRRIVLPTFGLTATKSETVVEKGDVAVSGGRSFPIAVAKKRKRLEDRIKRHGFEQTMPPKWMAVTALAGQESPDAVPLLVSLVDHGNQNTRFWARAALARMAKDDFKADKLAWNKWWMSQGHDAIDPALLKPYVPPTGN